MLLSHSLTVHPLVLIVDDEPLIRQVLADLLSDEGYRVDSAADGWEALERASEHPPNVVVSDVNMPRLGGVALVRALRADGYRIPVVLISAHYVAVDLPGVRFVAKPFNLDAISEAVERSLVAG